MTSADDKIEDSICHPSDQLLAAFLPGDRRALWTLKKRVSLQPGNFLFKAGDQPGKIFVHRRGVIQTIPTWGSQKCVDRHAAGIEVVYGLTETLSGKGFDFSIKSISSTEFDVIDKDDFFDFMRHRPELIQKLSAGLSALYGKALRKLRKQ